MKTFVGNASCCEPALCPVYRSATPNGRNDLSTSNIAEKHLVDALYPFDPHRVVLAREISAYRPHLLASGQPNLDLPQHSDNLLCCIVRPCHSPPLPSASEIGRASCRERVCQSV